MPVLQFWRLKVSKDPAIRRAAASALGVKPGVLSVKALVGALGDSDVEVRQSAAEALGKLGDARGIEPLMAMHRTGGRRDRRHALAALARIADGRAFEFLVTLLQPSARHTAESAELVSVAAALCRIGDPRAVTPLVTILNDASYAVRQAAIDTLGSLGWTPTNPSHEAVAAVTRREWDRVVQLGRVAVDPLVHALRDVDNADWLEAARALGRLGAPGVQPLITLITGRASVLQERVIEALGVAGPAAISPLFLALKKEKAHRVGLETPKTIAPLLAGLAKIGAPTVSWMVEVLASGEQSDRPTAAEVLRSVGDASAAPALRSALTDPGSSVRWSAANALEGIGCEPREGDELRPVFLVAAQRWDDTVRLGQRSVSRLLAVLSDANVSCQAARALGNIADPRGVEPLVGLLTNEKSMVRRTAVEALGNFGGAAVEPLLRTAVHDADMGVRLETATSLGKIGTPAAISGLVEALSDRDGRVRQRAAGALDALGWGPSDPTETAAFAVAQQRWSAAVEAGEAACAALARAHGDPEFNVRFSAAEALVEINHPNGVMATLLQAMQQPGVKVRRRAVEALGKTRDPLVCEQLGKALLDRDAYVQRAASMGLARLGEAGIPPLVAALQTSNSNAKELAVEALGTIGTAEVVEPLVRALVNRNYTGAVAARALGKIGDVRAIEPLIGALSNSADLVCEAAEALGKFADTRAVKPLLAALPANVGNDVRKRDKTRAIMSALTAIGVPALEELLAALVDPKAPRWAVATVLGRCGDLRAVEPLIAALAEPKPGQGAVAEALGLFGDARAVPSLIAAVSEHNLPEAVVALGRIADPRAIDSLIAYANRRNGGTIDEYNLEPSRVAPAIAALEKILKYSAEVASEESLKVAAAFSDLSESIWYMVDGCTRGTRSSSISCAPVRQLARQELIRRGEQGAEASRSN